MNGFQAIIFEMISIDYKEKSLSFINMYDNFCRKWLQTFKIL